MSEKALIISIVALLGIGFLGVLAIAIPWTLDYGVNRWKEIFLEDGLIIVGVILFIYGAYVNLKIH